MKTAWGGANYSTDEQIVGTWIDGKPIYQKTVDCGTLPNTAYKTVAHGISNLDTVLKAWGIGWNNSSGRILLPFMDDESPARIAIAADATTVFIGSRQFDASMYTNSAVTVQYTKTTD